MTAALRFELGCPECGGELEPVSATDPSTRTTSSILECVDCAITVRVTVSLRLCDARRYDLGPLLDWIGEADDMSAVADRLQVDRKTAYYYKRHGISDLTADRIATRLNVHPSMIWPTWWQQGEGAA